MKKKSILVWGMAAALILSICTGAIALIIWQIGPILNNPNLFNTLVGASGAATSTPVPVIERTPVYPPATATLTPRPISSPAGISPTLEPSPPAGELSLAEESAEEEIPAETEQTAGQAAPLALTTEELLLQAVLPERDQRLLAMRLKNNGQEIPTVVTDNSPNLQLGDIDTFWVTDNGQKPPSQFEATASVKYITDHAYWWVQDGINIDAVALERSAEQFESHTYPTNRAFFGSEWTPGVDNDARVHIFLGDVPGVAGYFHAANSYSKLAEPYSNEREMFYINIRSLAPGSAYFDSVLAHEFQHMIHWYQDRNEDTWVNEGLSELASFINGYGASSFAGFYANVPDTQLNSWTSSPADYGNSFLFMAYFLQRYGEEMTQAVVSHPKNGIRGFDAVLAEQGYQARFDDIFADFIVANYLNDPSLGEGQWGYEAFTPTSAIPTERYGVYPVEQRTTVYQYGADYIELSGEGDVTLEFTGSTVVKVVNNQAHSGDYQWYSHRGDDSNMRLTRAFDLSQVETATLNYWTWYDIEPDWDYGYVEVSADGGETWTILETPDGSSSNPSGNAYGVGYTGPSGDGPIWIEQSVDLSAYAGQEILLRFEYVTDDAVNHSGWTLDDISIPEIDFFDDVEAGPNGWQAEGFVRIDNRLPQEFLVQLVEIGDEISVRSLPLDETNYGKTSIEGLGSTLEKAVLIVSGVTPITTEPASYEVKLYQ